MYAVSILDCHNTGVWAKAKSLPGSLRSPQHLAQHPADKEHQYVWTMEAKGHPHTL